MAKADSAPGHTSSAAPVAHPSIFIQSLRVRNFRGLTKVKLTFEHQLTVLVGPNNSGKSRLLRALGLALGGLRVDQDDLTKGQDKPAEIDVVIAPASIDPAADQIFDDEVGRRLKPDTVQQGPDHERFAFRLTIMPSAEGGRAQSKYERLTFDHTSDRWHKDGNPQPVTREQFMCFSAHLVDTQRDLSQELRQQGSSIRRILSDLEVPTHTREDLETRLASLGTEIIDKSQSLAAVQDTLGAAGTTLPGFGRPALNPLPVTLEELSQSVSIDLDSGSGALPMRLHGSGPKSLASLLVQSVYYDRRLGKDGPELRPLPVTLLEEPENHLHPQMQAELPGLIDSLPGQTVLSTHSPTLVTELDPHTIRILQGNRVVDLKPDESSSIRLRNPRLNQTELEVLRRQIERPFGELLFCRAIVIGDGATERALLPPLIRSALGAVGSGVSVIDPGGMKGPSTGAAIKFAKTMGLPWFLFADDDSDGRGAVAMHCPAHEDPTSDDHGHVIFVGAGSSIEKLLIDFDIEICKKALLQLDPTTPIDNSEVANRMKRSKGAVGRTIASELIKSYHDPDEWPEPITRLVKVLGEALKS